MNYMSLIRNADESQTKMFMEYISKVLQVGINHRLEVQGEMAMQGKMIPMWLCDALKFRVAMPTAKDEYILQMVGCPCYARKPHKLKLVVGA